MSATRPFLAALAISLFLAGCANSGGIHSDGSPSNANSVISNARVALHRHDEALVLQSEGAASSDHADSLSTLHSTTAWQLGEPDLILKLRAPYSLPLENSDVFRNFVIPDVIGSDRYVRALEFKPGNQKVVHHAEFRLDETETSWQRDIEEPGPGYGGMGNATANYPDGHFVNWVPGKRVWEMQEGLAWRLPASADLVVQLHMMPSGFEVIVDPMIGLYFTDEPPKVNPQMMWLGSRWLPIAAGDSNFVVRDSYVLPHDVDVLSVLPHCHFICKDIMAWAILPNGSRHWLAQIDDWNFYEQRESHYEQPLSLPRGSTVSVEFGYDNSAYNERNPNSPPQDIEFGPLSSNEMADLWIQVMPQNPQESESLNLFSARHLEQRIIERQLREVELEPDVDGYIELARSYKSVGQLDKAVAWLREALVLAPENTEVMENLAITLTDVGRLHEALNYWRRWVQVAPLDARAHLSLGTALGFSNQVAAAASHLKLSTELDPSFAPAFFRLGRAQSYLGRFDDALLSFRAAVALSPNEPKLLHATARFLASHPEQNKRRAGEALELASRALNQLPEPDAMSLSTLAMAQAATGAFELAVTTARLALSRVSPDERSLASIIKRQVDHYEQDEIEVTRAAGVKQFVAPSQRHTVRRGK